MSERRGAHHYGAELQEEAEAKAERWVQQVLARLGWSEQDLAEQAYTDPKKAPLARRLRRETTMTMAWIARRLRMGSINTLKNTLRLANSRDGPLSPFQSMLRPRRLTKTQWTSRPTVVGCAREG